MEQRIEQHTDEHTEQRKDDVDADAYPYITEGERMTVSLANGPTWGGTLVSLHYRPDGLLACMRFLPEGDTEPLAINADHIAAWRRGEPVRTSQPVGAPGTLQFPAELLNGLNGQRFPGRG